VKKILLITLFISLNLFAYKGLFQSVSKEEVTFLQKGKKKDRCPACNMHIPQFYKTSHAIKSKDGSYRQYCSLYCVADELEFEHFQGKKEQIEKILVVDVISLRYIDVKKAFYVVGSNIPGTMSYTSKYAFKKREEALKFQKENGGEIMDFNGAYKITLKKDFNINR
jgi:copper chaperone NosL